MDITTIGLGAAALLLLGGGGNKKCVGRTATINGKSVCEEDLPAMGYVQWQGQWYHQTQFSPAAAGQIVSASSPQWYTYLNTLLAAGTSLAPLLGTLAPLTQKPLDTAILSAIGATSAQIERTKAVSAANAPTVKYVQTMINNATLPPYAMVQIDGVFGTNTRNALERLFGTGASSRTLNQLIR